MNLTNMNINYESNIQPYDTNNLNYENIIQSVLEESKECLSIKETLLDIINNPE